MHVDKLPQCEKTLVMNASYNAGLFLWVGDKTKHKGFISSLMNQDVRLIRSFRRVLVLFSVIGVFTDNMCRWFDNTIFKEKNKANLIVYGMGAFHRLYLIHQQIPLAYGMITNYKGPFPITHPYFHYESVTFFSTSNLDRFVILISLMTLLLGMNVIFSLMIGVPTQIVIILASRLFFQNQTLFYYKLRTLEKIQIVLTLICYGMTRITFPQEKLIENTLIAIFYLSIMNWVCTFKTLTPKIRNNLE